LQRRVKNRPMRGGLDFFKVHEEVIADYGAFTSGFVEVRDERIKTFVDQQFEDGIQWPDPGRPQLLSPLARGTRGVRIRADVPVGPDRSHPSSGTPVSAYVRWH
jgi:hypothetical protein